MRFVLLFKFFFLLLRIVIEDVCIVYLYRSVDKIRVWSDIAIVAFFFSFRHATTYQSISYTISISIITGN